MPAYGKPIAGFCAATAVFICSASGFPVAPASVPLSSGTLVMSGASSGVTNVTAGQKVTLSGSGYAGDAAVAIAVYSSPDQLANVVASPSGQVQTTVTVPRDLLGSHILVALGNDPGGAARALEAPINVSAPSASSVTNMTLPFTGMNVVGLLLGGFGLILAGFVLIRTAVFRRKFLTR